MRHQKPSLTLFADASVYKDHKVAGWGGYARGDGRDPTWAQGPAKFDEDVTTVELWALANIVESVVSSSYITSEDTHILLQSDCLFGLEMLWCELPNTWATAGSDATIKTKRTVTQSAKTPIQSIKANLSGCQLIYLKHVKGHKNGIHSRSWVNERCDVMAKEEARRQFK